MACNGRTTKAGCAAVWKDGCGQSIHAQWLRQQCATRLSDTAELSAQLTPLQRAAFALVINKDCS
eukprot:1160729-Pelagomonas_calceolata.AAC.22